ncbi:OB-fold nucleic acid binding domain-containing protein [Micropruina sp.]|jgi:RecG-like helicase|uniref:OB-fold nucleic acid binding domain-containing protein n=1 Tax=Micropruina sp. TaxID=2737536 RepID=UPI002628C512|nr:OB-fold nucleic acid binding domain-containing protein [Micropruina sp.]
MPANPFERALRWFGRSTEELDSEAAVKAAQASGAMTIADCADRQRATLRGRIAVLTLRPRSGTPWLEAELTDGSGSITLIWMGRREIPGLIAGRELKVTGRVSWVDGRRRMYNPYYELL